MIELGIANEKDTPRISGTIKDSTGTVIPSASLSSLTITLYDQATGAIINSRNAQSILNANGGSVHATSGAFTFDFSIDDMVIVGNCAPGNTERHIALIVWIWSSGTRRRSEEYAIDVESLEKVT